MQEIGHRQALAAGALQLGQAQHAFAAGDIHARAVLHRQHGARRTTGSGQGLRGPDLERGTVGQARERATDTWDRLEKVFEDRVQRALTKLGVPGRDDLAELTRKVDTLTAELRRQGPAPASRAKRTAAPARKATSKTTTARKARKSA